MQFMHMYTPLPPLHSRESAHQPLEESRRKEPAADPKALWNSQQWKEDLKGRVKTGTGEARSSLSVVGEGVQDGLKTLGKKSIGFVGGLVVGLIFILPGKLLGWAGEYFMRREEVRRDAQAVSTLGNIKVEPSQSRFGQHYDAVIDSLVQHCGQTGAQLSRDELTELVQVGEGIWRALETDTPPAPSTYTARALAWYIAASAALQDLSRESNDTVKDLSPKGIFKMSDPGHKIHAYLSAVPGASTRMSSHYAERSLSERNWLGSPLQCGIEDYRNRLPGGGGAILADKQAGLNGSDVTVIKFETAGMPPFFVEEDGAGLGTARFFAAWGRTSNHIANFAKTRGNKTAKRTEHIDKDLLGKEVGKPFKALLRKAIDRGIINAEYAPLVKDMKHFGFEPTLAVLELIVESASEIESSARSMTTEQALRIEPPASNTRQEAEALINKISEWKERLGAHSPSGLHRKAAEADVDLGPRAQLEGLA